MSIDAARAVADAVLYEGYLLYPYRATSAKNQLRWQFGVLGPRGAERAGTGEAPGLSMQCLVRVAAPDLVAGAALRIHLRCLQVQHRRIQRSEGQAFADVAELTVGSTHWLPWDEAVEVERAVEVTLDELESGSSFAIDVPPAENTERLVDETGTVVGRLVRERWPVRASVSARLEPAGGTPDLWRLTVGVDNEATASGLDKDGALRRSLVGTHLLVEALAPGVSFVSVIEPPEDAEAAAATCRQQRCWPVLAGADGDDRIVLGSPIILYDHPEIAEQSAGALFDSTEIDEILTLRVMTMTDAEKAEARATDPRAAEIIDRCDRMTPEELQRLHGVLRDPFGAVSDPFADGLFEADQKPWWDPDAEATVDPAADCVVVDGVQVAKDSLVRIHPTRRADAQDLFFAGQVAKVTSIHRDVDGETHVAVVLVDDPAADLHEWYGRYLYFAPDEIRPLSPPAPRANRND